MTLAKRGNCSVRNMPPIWHIRVRLWGYWKLLVCTEAVRRRGSRWTAETAPARQVDREIWVDSTGLENRFHYDSFEEVLVAMRNIGTIKSVAEFTSYLNQIGVSLPFTEVVTSGPDSPLSQPYALGDRVIGNRFAILPDIQGNGFKDLGFKLRITFKNYRIRIFFQKSAFQIGLDKFFRPPFKNTSSGSICSGAFMWEKVS